MEHTYKSTSAHPLQTLQQMEGLPQGSVLSFLLFTICINDLLVKFEDDTFVCAYADDMAIARCARNKDVIIASLQPEVDKVVAWSAKMRLTLKISKCEMAFFSLDYAEHQPNIAIDGIQMFRNPLSVFLGVRYHQQVTFGEHVQSSANQYHPAIMLFTFTFITTLFITYFIG